MAWALLTGIDDGHLSGLQRDLRLAGNTALAHLVLHRTQDPTADAGGATALTMYRDQYETQLVDRATVRDITVQRVENFLSSESIVLLFLGSHGLRWVGFRDP